MSKRRPNREARRAELPSAGSLIQSRGSVSNVNPAGFCLATSWNSSGGRYYFDLNHYRGRATIILQMYDRVRNSYIAEASEYQPLPGNETSILRIWLDWDPGADRIVIMFI